MMKGVVIERPLANNLRKAEKMVEEAIGQCRTRYEGEGQNLGGQLRMKRKAESDRIQGMIVRAQITEKERARAELLASLVSN